jgi:hypothetical protein
VTCQFGHSPIQKPVKLILFGDDTCVQHMNSRLQKKKKKKKKAKKKKKKKKKKEGYAEEYEQFNP